MDGHPTLRTERLVLRPFTVSDAGDVQHLAGDAAIADTTLNIPHPYEDGMAESWIATHRPALEEGKSVTFAVTLTDTGELVGAVGLTFSPRFDHAELGYWIGRPYWSRGYATEASGAVLGYAFEVRDLNRVHAHHFARNPASGWVMRKLGMQREAYLRQHARKRGAHTYEDLVGYGVLRTDWIHRGAYRSARSLSDS